MYILKYERFGNEQELTVANVEQATTKMHELTNTPFISNVAVYNKVNGQLHQYIK